MLKSKKSNRNEEKYYRKFNWTKILLFIKGYIVK